MAAKKNRKMKQPVKKSRLPFIIVVAAIAVAAAGAAVAVGLAARGGSSGNGSPKPPDFAYSSSAPAGSAKAYQFALDHPQLLAQVPCYCGCGMESGHKSNLDCYIKSRQGNDVTFDDHASY